MQSQSQLNPTPQPQYQPPVIPKQPYHQTIQAHTPTQMQQQPQRQQLYDSSLTLQSIETLIAPLGYKDNHRIARDVLGLIQNSNSLAFKIGTFVHSNGVSQNLLQLLGTTPIYFRGVCYNIPVAIWLVQQYPERPPICYVTPTKDMRIKDGHRHVDHFGLIYLPYLNQWSAHTSNLLEMVTMMSSTFSADPPVFKVPSSTPTTVQPNQAQPPQQPTQPVSQPPYVAPPPNPFVQQQQPTQQQPQPQQQPRLQQISSPSPSNSSSQSPSSAQLHQVEQDPRALRKDQLIATLTSKLRQQLQDDLSLKTLLMDDLLQNQVQLESHSQSITDKIATLNADLQRFEQANAELSNKNAELAKWLESNEKREMVDIDKACYIKDTWSKQLLDNVSLDHALEDAYYVLDRALSEDRIELHSYTKQMRNLSRKQFYARALLQQIQLQQLQHQQQQNISIQPVIQHQQQQQHQQAQLQTILPGHINGTPQGATHHFVQQAQR